nr:uncharacterized protein LOC111502946 [Leptinotarsa decemlineata]
MRAKKKIDDFGEPSATCCDKDKKITQKEESCKKHDQGCKHDKEDPCKNFKPKKKPTKEEMCGKSKRNADDSCKKFDENKSNRKCEQKTPREDCMKPSEVTCTKGNSMKPRPCCEQVSVCEEPKLPMIKPKCSDENPKRDNSKNATEKKPDHCKQVPMPADCPMKIDAEEKRQHGDSINCTQKSCTQKSMEPTEPPNCCKPRSKKEDKKCTKTFEGQQVLEGKEDIRQISCQEIMKQKEEVAKLTKIPTCPPKPIPKKVKDSTPCPTASKSDVRYCTKLSKKEKEYVPEQANPAKMPRQHHEEHCIQRPTPESREPRQVPKDTWMPVKINRGKHPKNNLQKTKSTPCTKTEITSKSTCPKLNSQNPKEECSQKSFLDNCKGIVSSVYRILCPGKNKKSGKKAASLGLIRSLSLPEIKGLTGGTLTASSGSNYGRKKPGTMCFAHYKTKNKYPWKQTNRWSLCNERFLSKKSDPCEPNKEETAPEANKLNCICYEEMKKFSERRSNNQTAVKEVCEKKSQAESTKHLNFKLTDHSKICQAASKSKLNSKIKKCDSRPKQDQSMFNQCGEISKQAKSVNSGIETVPQDKCKKLAISTDKKNQEMSCMNKLKNNTEAAVKEDSTKIAAEQTKSCLDKLKDKRTTEQKKEHIEQIHKTTTNERNSQSLKKPHSILRPKSSLSFKHKYPWQKSEEKMDAELCPNQSSITTRLSGLEKRYGSETICTKPKMRPIKQSDNEKQEKGDLTGKNRYTLEVEKDGSCFKGQAKQGQSNTRQKSEDHICNKPNIKESTKDLPTTGQGKDGKCLTNKKDNKGDITEKKKFSLENKKESCCFKVCEKVTAKKENKEQEKDDKCLNNKGNKDTTTKEQKKDGKCLADKINKEGLTEKKKFSLENKKESCCFKACEKDTTKKENKEQKKDEKCPGNKKNEEMACENVNKKYFLDKKKDSLCFNEKPKRSQSEPKSICEGIKKSQNEMSKDCSNYNKECTKENLKNLLENYNKTIEKMLAKDEKSSENAKKRTVCETKSHIGDGKEKSGSIKDICLKMRKKESREEERVKNQQCQKTVESRKSDKPGSTRQKDALGVNDIKLDENEDDVFICKVKKLGKSEQFICSAKGGECKMSSEPEKGVVRVLKCKLTKDDCGRDVFVCKEIKPMTAGDGSSEAEYEKMKQLLKQKSSPELPTRRMTISKKLVCRERTEDESNEVQKEKICNVHEVREIVGGKSIKKQQSESSRRKCPFSYKDLLKKSEQIRKATKTESSKKDKRSNNQDCKDKLKT